MLRPVPECTRRFLTERFSKPLPNEARLRVRRQFALPDVEATKVPQMDFFVKSHASNAAKSTDRELAKLQALINDGIAPITAILTKGDKEESMSGDEVLKAAESAAELLGNASAKLSQLRREKLTSDFNKSLLPLVKSGMDFSEASPRLFGAEFPKLAKEHVEEMKALKSTLPSRSDSRPFIRSGPSRRGGAVADTKATSLQTRQGADSLAARDCRPDKLAEEASSRRTSKGKTSRAVVQRDGSTAGNGHCAIARPAGSGWEAETFCCQVAENHDEPLGPGDSKRLRHRSALNSQTSWASQGATLGYGSRSYARLRAEQTVRQRCRTACGRIPGRICFHNVPGSKKGWGPKASGKLEDLEQLRGDSPFQDEGPSHSQRSAQARRLARQDRPKGRLLCDPNTARPPEVSAVHGEGPIVSLHMPAVRALIGTVGLHKNPQACSSGAASHGCPHCLLHRRYSGSGRDQGSGERTRSSTQVFAGMPGVCGAPGEVYHDARPDNRIFGHSGGLYCD